MKALLLLCLFGIACHMTDEERKQADAQERRIEARRVRWVKNRLVYFRDDRSGLCFAKRWNYFSNVPCEKVEHLLEKQ